MQAPEMNRVRAVGAVLGAMSEANGFGANAAAFDRDPQVLRQIAQKHLATLVAQFALLGHTLQVQHRGCTPLYVVSRWGQSRTFTHLHDVEAFHRQIAGGSDAR